MSDQLTTERLRELAAGATLYGHERNAMATELLAKREECDALAYRAEDAESQLRCVTLTGDAVASDSSLYCGNSVRYWYDKARAYKDAAGNLCEAMKERDAARAESKRYHDALVARHGGEPVALLSELDEARAEVERLQGIIDDTESESGLAALQIDESLEEHPTLPDFVKHIVEERVAYGEEADALSKEAKKLRAHVEALQSWQDGIIIACGSLGLQPSEVAAHIEKLRGIKPGMPERISAGARFGIRWNGPQSPLAVPMDDGYWTPWHVANAEAEKLRADLQAMTVEAMRAGREANELRAELDAWRSLGTEGEPVADVVERLRHVMEEHAKLVSCNYEAELAAVKRQRDELLAAVLPVLEKIEPKPSPFQPLLMALVAAVKAAEQPKPEVQP